MARFFDLPFAARFRVSQSGSDEVEPVDEPLTVYTLTVSPIVLVVVLVSFFVAGPQNCG
jgi:hypothetical protein